ncbi:MAG TPA: YqaJ viral recombinase family protein [Streptosporangiaceae bacterium]|nr:YqaJ viral recombinase family protein [Streptosporangiaceae bacterium]
MTATLIPTATEAEWLAARRQGITASEIAVIMGLSNWSSPYKLFHQKTGALPPDDDSDRLGLGRYLEPYIVQRFTGRHPEFCTGGTGRELFAHPRRPWQMATPDRLLFDDEGANAGHAHFDSPRARDPISALECKSWGTFDGWGDDGSDDIPVHIRCQALWQADVMGVGTVYVACVFLPGAQLRVYEVVADDTCARADLKLMREEAETFLARIDRNDEPDVDWRPATADALKRLHPDVEDIEAIVGVRTAISYRAACRRFKEAERRKDEMTNRVRAEMGSAHYAKTWRGDPVARRDVYDVKAHTRRASHVDKIVPVAPPKPKGEPSP